MKDFRLKLSSEVNLTKLLENIEGAYEFEVVE